MSHTRENFLQNSNLISFATKNSIQPNLLRNWKREFLEKALDVLDDFGEDNLKEKLINECKEKTEYAKKLVNLACRRIG